MSQKESPILTWYGDTLQEDDFEEESEEDECYRTPLRGGEENYDEDIEDQDKEIEDEGKEEEKDLEGKEEENNFSSRHEEENNLESKKNHHTLRFASEVSFITLDEDELIVCGKEETKMAVGGERPRLQLERSLLKDAILSENEKTLRRKLHVYPNGEIYAFPAKGKISQKDNALTIQISGKKIVKSVKHDRGFRMSEVAVEHPLIAVEDAIRAIHPIALSDEEVADLWSKVEGEFEPKFSVKSLFESEKSISADEKSSPFNKSADGSIVAIFVEEIARLAAFLRLRSSERMQVIERSRMIQNQILLNHFESVSKKEEKVENKTDEGKVEENKTDEGNVLKKSETSAYRATRCVEPLSERTLVRDSPRRKRKKTLVVESDTETEQEKKKVFKSSCAAVSPQDGIVIDVDGSVHTIPSVLEKGNYQLPKTFSDSLQIGTECTSCILYHKTELLKSMILAGKDLPFIQAVMMLV